MGPETGNESRVQSRYSIRPLFGYPQPAVGTERNVVGFITLSLYLGCAGSAAWLPTESPTSRRSQRHRARLGPQASPEQRLTYSDARRFRAALRLESHGGTCKETYALVRRGALTEVKGGSHERHCFGRFGRLHLARCRSTITAWRWKQTASTSSVTMTTRSLVESRPRAIDSGCASTSNCRANGDAAAYPLRGAA